MIKLLGNLLGIGVFLALIFAIWWVFILPTPISVPVSQKTAWQYLMFKPLQVKAVYIDQKKNAELIPVYEPLANDDNIVAQYYLGRVYYNLPTTPKAPNYHNALRYFQTAASEGWPDAQNAYGVMLMNGRGVPLNRVEAYKWFSIAAQAGHQKAQSNLSLVSSQMTMDEVYEGEKNASYWMNGFIKVNERRGDQLDLSHSLQP